MIQPRREIGRPVSDERSGSVFNSSQKGDNVTCQCGQLTPPLKWHGGKSYLAKWIVSLMPERCRTPNKPKSNDPGYLHFCEPYAGGLSVLLANDPDGISEVTNDLNGDLTNFWQVLQSPEFFERFRRRVEATPFSESEWQAAEYLQSAGLCDTVDWAWAFFVCCRQSLAGRMDSFAPLSRTRTRRGMNEQASAWLNAVEGLPAIHERLKRVVILNRDALDVIRQQDGPRTLFYLDPPYLHSTRVTTEEYGDYEMFLEDHKELLRLLTRIKGRFLLSGYHSKLYDKVADRFSWKCHENRISNHASSSNKKRVMTECVWTNF